MPATERAMVERLLPAWGRGPRLGDRLGGGFRNSVYEVTLDGRRYAARLSLRPEPALAWELELLAFLAAHELVVPLPQPTWDGRLAVDGLTLFSWVDGDPPGSDADWRAVGETLGWVHALTRSWPQRPGFRSTAELLTEWRGGDVCLDRMPPAAVERCRAAWRPLAHEPRSVVHGDPGAGNIRISRSGVGLLDWDEARVDASVLDLADVPLDLSVLLGAERLAVAQRAADAWEAANGWFKEPEYARRRLARLG